MVTASELMASNTGPARSMTAGSPPTMHTRSPEAAAAGPPVTPQSSTGTPRAAASAPMAWTHGGRDGAHDDERGARAGRGQPAVRAGQHGVDLLVVDHGHHHHVGPADQVGRRGRHLGRPAVLVGGLGPHVADHQGEARRSTLVATPSPMAPRPMTPTVGRAAVRAPPVGWSFGTGPPPVGFGLLSDAVLGRVW